MPVGGYRTLWHHIGRGLPERYMLVRKSQLAGVCGLIDHREAARVAGAWRTIPLVGEVRSVLSSPAMQGILRRNRVTMVRRILAIMLPEQSAKAFGISTTVTVATLAIAIGASAVSRIRCGISMISVESGRLRRNPPIRDSDDSGSTTILRFGHGCRAGHGGHAGCGEPVRFSGGHSPVPSVCVTLAGKFRFLFTVQTQHSITTSLVGWA